MIREDDYAKWAPSIDALEAAGAWRIVEATEPRDNFTGTERTDDGTPLVQYRMRVFKRNVQEQSAREVAMG